MECMFSLNGNSSTTVSKLSSPFKAKCINTRRKIKRQIGVNASSKSSGKSYKISLLSGDGIGPEVTRVAKDVLQLVASREDVNFNFKEMLLGGAAIDATGVPLPEETLAACQLSDAVLLAAVGGYKWDNNEHHLRPEYGLLQLRSKLGVFANLRPAIVFPQLVDVSTLKPDVVSGVDFMIIRELTGGIYFANPKGYGTNENGEKIAFNTEVYSSSEVDRIARVAFDIARKRGKQLCSVDKANVLEVSQFWRERVIAISDGYQDVQLSHMYVDIAATQLIRNPKQFDTIVTNNVFGDILSEEASVLTGSSAMLPSACVGESGPGIFEPRHESSQDIANQDKANPLAMILSAAMMLKYGLCEEHAAVQIERAVMCTLDKGFRTADLMSPGKTLVGCAKMGEEVMKSLETL